MELGAQYCLEFLKWIWPQKGSTLKAPRPWDGEFRRNSSEQAGWCALLLAFLGIGVLASCFCFLSGVELVTSFNAGDVLVAVCWGLNTTRYMGALIAICWALNVSCWLLLCECNTWYFLSVKHLCANCCCVLITDSHLLSDTWYQIALLIGFCRALIVWYVLITGPFDCHIRVQTWSTLPAAVVYSICSVLPQVLEVCCLPFVCWALTAAVLIAICWAWNKCVLRAGCCSSSSSLSVAYWCADCRVFRCTGYMLLCVLIADTNTSHVLHYVLVCCLSFAI